MKVKSVSEIREDAHLDKMSSCKPVLASVPDGFTVRLGGTPQSKDDQ